MKKVKFTDERLIQLLKQAGATFKLSASDKGILKAELMDVIKTGPDRIKRGSRKVAYQFSRRKYTMPLIPIIIAALIAIGGGTAALADSAKPGDFLYPVDQWVERFQERVTWTDEAKAGLLARFSEERLQELQALLEIDPEQLQERARERWRAHKEMATEHLAESVERANMVRERFEGRLTGVTDEDEQVEIQQVIDTMDEIIARREQRMEEVESSEFPGAGQVPVRQQVQQWTRENQETMEQVREQIQEEFGDEMPGFGAGEPGQHGKGQSSVDPAIALLPQSPIQLPVADGLVEAQQEWQKRVAETGQQIAAKLAEVLEQVDPFEDPNRLPQPELLVEA